MKKFILIGIIPGVLVFIGLNTYRYIKKENQEHGQLIERLQTQQEMIFNRCIEMGGVPSVNGNFQSGSGFITKVERCDFPVSLSIENKFKK